MDDGRSRIWMPLDNAALIFPAIRRRNWNNVFRESVTLREAIDPVLLQRAVPPDLHDEKGDGPLLPSGAIFQ